MDRPQPALRVVVWSCSSLGEDVARRLIALDEVAEVTLITAPWRTSGSPRPLLKRVRHSLRYDGPLATLKRIAGKVGGVDQADTNGESQTETQLSSPRATASALHPAISTMRFARFDAPDAVAALHDDKSTGRAAPRFDLGVVAGASILPPDVFEAPRLGSINLHSGRVPDYRGSAPAFWELYNGENEVGVTVHRVATALDAGDVVAQTLVPLDADPRDDVLDFLETYRHHVLRPVGVRLLAESVVAIADGTARFTPQPSIDARTYPKPTFRDVQELRRRIRDRQRSEALAIL